MPVLSTTVSRYLLFAAMLFCTGTKSYAQPADVKARIALLIDSIPPKMRSNEDEAHRMLAELQQLSQQYQHKKGTIKTLFFHAWIGYRHGSADATINRIDSALQFVQEIHEDSSLADFYILKGQCYVKKTQFNLALHNFSLALDISKRLKDLQTETGALISIGWAYMEDGKPAEAIRFFNEVLRLNPGEAYNNRALVICNIAACYNIMGDYKQAEKFALQGIAEARRLNTLTDLANGLNILGRSYYQQGKTTQAIEVLKEASQVREKVADPSMQASDYLELASLFLKIQQPGVAVFWAKKAEALSVQHSNSLKIVGAYEVLANA